MGRKFFVVFEGIDGSGKSTQAKLLFDYLKKHGFDAVLFAEPSSGTYGQLIRKELASEKELSTNHILNLFIQDRQDDVNNNILPALNDGKIVILDRYYYSNAAYQGAMGLDTEMILKQNLMQNFPKPDRVYFIDISVQAAMERINARLSNSKEVKEVFEKVSFLEKVKANYNKLKLADESFITVNAEREINDIHKEIINDFLAEYGQSV